MKKSYAIIGLFLLTLTTQAALPQPDLIAQIYFAGAQKISANAHASAFTNEFCSTEAVALRAQTADKLSRWLAGWLQTHLNVTVADGAEKLRPFFDDLQTSEWFLEARVATTGKPEVALAIKLDAIRTQLWKTNLKSYFGPSALKSVDGWLIFDSDPSLLKLGDQLAHKVSAPPDRCLDLDINWPRLAQWYSVLQGLSLPETQFTLTAPDNNFQVNGKFYFPENLALTLESWRVPTNTIHGPIDSFTAVRGFAPWLQSQKWAQPYRLATAPNQFFSWSLPSFPYQTFAAVPVPNAAMALQSLYEQLLLSVAAANARHEFIMNLIAGMTNNEISFKGMPFINLNIRALVEPAGQFLFLTLFPNSGRNQPLPAELFLALAKKNLLYYHLENSSVRMPQMLQVSQFSLMFTRHKQLDAKSVAFSWLQKIGPKLGSMDTEITQSGPAEFTFTRKAPGIFSAIEFYALGNWLEAKNFPGCDLKLPPSPLMNQRSKPVVHVITPAPAPGH